MEKDIRLRKIELTSDKKILFICNTPYQIMVAIAIKVFVCKANNADIIISNHMNNSQKWKSNLISSGEFKNVSVVDNKKCVIGSKTDRFFNKTYCAFTKCRKLSNLNLDNYDSIYLYNMFCFEESIFSELYQNNPSIKVFLFEDGLATYIGNMMETWTNKGIKKFIYTFSDPLNKRIYLKDFIKGIYVFSPDMIKYKLPIYTYGIFDGFTPDQLTKKMYGTYKNIISKLFEYDVPELPKLVFFEEPQLQDQFYDLLNNTIDIFSSEIIGIKPHPRSLIDEDDRIISDRTIMINSGYSPWEVVCLNQNIEDKILISLRSTAMVTPKLIFDQEPIVIWLFNIFPEIINDDGLNTKLSDIVDVLRKNYKNPKRVIVPDSIQDFYSILRKINKGAEEFKHYE